jgi:hypothetical protein
MSDHGAAGRRGTLSVTFVFPPSTRNRASRSRTGDLRRSRCEDPCRPRAGRAGQARRTRGQRPGIDRIRARHRAARQQRAHQHADRPPAFRFRQDRRDTPRACVPQARRPLPRPAGQRIHRFPRAPSQRGLGVVGYCRRWQRRSLPKPPRRMPPSMPPTRATTATCLPAFATDAVAGRGFGRCWTSLKPRQRRSPTKPTWPGGPRRKPPPASRSGAGARRRDRRRTSHAGKPTSPTRTADCSRPRTATYRAITPKQSRPPTST